MPCASARSVASSFFLFSALFSTTVMAEELGHALSRTAVSYSCDEADRIRFDRAKYEALDLTSRQLVDFKYAECEFKARTHGGLVEDATPVLVVNPAPTANTPKVFYGIMKKSDLEQAQKDCTKGLLYGSVAVVLAAGAAGKEAAADAGGVVYKYADLTCSTLANGLANDNLSTLLAPQFMVNESVTKKLIEEVIEEIPLLSDEDASRIINFINKNNVVPVVKVGKGKIQVQSMGVPVEVGISDNTIPAPQVSVGGGKPIPIPTTPLGGSAIIVDEIVKGLDDLF